MSEFGNETATAVFKFGTKMMEEFFKLLKFIFERNERKLNREIKKAQLDELKGKQSSLSREEKLEKRREWLSKQKGLVKYKDMIKGKEPLYPVGLVCSQKEIDRLSRIAKIEGVPFTILKNSVVLNRINEIEKELKQLEIEGSIHTKTGVVKDSFKKENLTEESQAKYDELKKELEELENRREEAQIMVRECDLEHFKNLTDRMNQEIRLADINKKCGEYENKGMENLSKEERVEYENLKHEKECIHRGEFDSFNKKNNDVIRAGAEGQQVAWEEMSFESALARVTDREYATQTCYICERTNPDRYIEVTSEQRISDKAESKGKTFTATEYKVFCEGKAQESSFADKKFSHWTDAKGESTSNEGRNRWEKTKEEIKEKGGFSDDVLIFPNVEMYEEYKQGFRVKEEQIKLEEPIISEEPISREDTIGAEFDDNSYKDYMGVVNKLKSQLEEHHLTLNAKGEVCKADGELLAIKPNMSDNEKLETAEMINIGKQIALYEQLNKNQNAKAMACQQIEENKELMEVQGEGMKAIFEKSINSLQEQVKECTQKELELRNQVKKLQDERMQIVSVDIVSKVQEESVIIEEPVRQQEAREENQQDFNNEKNDDFTHGEEIRGQHKADYERQIDRGQNNIPTNDIGKDMEITSDIGERS